MSRVDENGVLHPTDSDPWDTRTQAHLAFCLECNPYALRPSVFERTYEPTVSADELRQMVLDVNF